MNMRALAWSDETEALEPIEEDQAEKRISDGCSVWIDLTTRDAAKIAALHRRFGIRKSILNDAAGAEQLPKVEAYEHSIFAVLHALAMRDNQLDTTQINCVITENLFVTISERRSPGTDWLWERAQQPVVRRARTPDQLFGHLAEVIGHRYLAVMNEFDELIDDVYDQALTARRRVLRQIQLLRREGTSISKVLRPQRVLLNDMRSFDHPVLSDDGHEIIGDAFDVHNLVVESLRSTRSLLADTLDSYRGATGDRQSTASTLLAVYSAVMLPVSFIGGFYGMNVALPGEKNPRAWIVITVAMVLIVVVSLAIFVKVGFIRTPHFGNKQPTSAIKRGDRVRVSGEHDQTRNTIEQHTAHKYVGDANTADSTSSRTTRD